MSLKREIFKMIHLTKVENSRIVTPRFPKRPEVKWPRMPRRGRMTLCMAAACQHNGEPRIVLCTDWQQQVEGIGGAENRNKMEWIKAGWPALIADVLCHADALIDEYSTHLARVTLHGSNVFTELKKPAHAYKRALAADYIKQLLGVDYDFFLQQGKEKFPDEYLRERVEEVSRIKLGVSLIIAGFVACVNLLAPKKTKMQTCLCVVEDSDEHQDVVRIEQDFAAIGSGAYVASAALFHRSQNHERDLMPTIYTVFEAHRFAAGSKVPGVGEAMSIDVLEPNGIRLLSQKGFMQCEHLYSKFGPRNIKERHIEMFEMDEKFLEKFGTDRAASWEPCEDRSSSEKTEKSPG
jgi:hypothetical protein